MSYFNLIYVIVIVLLISPIESRDGSVKTQTENRFVQPLVHGGTKTIIYKAPYMALLFDVKIGFFCGATIVRRRFLLTAAHCYNPYSKYYVKVGTDTIDGGYRYDIDKIVIHPDFDETINNNDIAVIKLKTELTFNKRVRPIKMAPNYIKFKSGVMMTTMGFGATEDQSESHDLLRVDVPYVSYNDCKSMIRFITNRMICAGGVRGQDACSGDSGGPLIYGDMIVGVVSSGIGCGEELPGVYASIPALRDFIDQTIRHLSKARINHMFYRT
ncbi:trypsin 5G1-like [Vanessa atalanta]|uniref:trypsin 5G1-like n=1 Tax=Vanessa atalanta TaxID=42275 RepID=UPI001FCD7F0F|nr:trypsin 5G1-like [Vanessa atalanta]